MPNRSQMHSYEYHGEDASGFKGYTLDVSPASLTPTHPATPDLTLTLLDYDGAPVSGVVISATSSNTGVATVTASDTTDAAGSATITVTTVAAGSTVVSFSYTGAGRPSIGSIPVTVS
ncbi:MAG: Ig-like domain-containing protein [Pseudomonas sp.]|nr:Ig-like domain-containing protein [Pseudomonas sp.]